jgi:Flp pilus assembly protein TadG
MSVAGPIPLDMSMRNERFKLAQLAGFLSKLRRDRRGNALAMGAALIVPLAGMVGGGLDMGRLYITKTRLQHACDAGALAGRKAMGSGNWSNDSYAARATARQFFDGNFAEGSYGSNTLVRDFAENAGKVTGTASVVVPMTLMRIFKEPQKTLTVTCDAEMRLPNTDVMFVLDTTGSMNDKAVATDSDTKIVALKKAVKCFYEIVARLDTTANCTYGAPTGGTGNQVQIRFGFMPYSTNVNVGKLLPTSYFANSWSYQTRTPLMKTETTTTDGPWVNGTAQLQSETTGLTSNSNWEEYKTTSATKAANCTTDNDNPVTYSGPEGAPTNQNETISGNTRTTTWTTRTDAKRQYKYQTVYSSGTCSMQRRINYGYSDRTYSRTDSRTQTTTTQQVFDKWRYAQKDDVDVSGLKNGTSWNNSLMLPVGSNGANVSVPWDGCIEERATVKQNSFATIPSAAKDLDIDLVPSQGDSTTLWGPALQRATFLRKIPTTPGWTAGSRDVDETTTDYWTGFNYFCPTEAKKLQQWPTAGDFETYVDSLTPSGNTYHDIGMLWGARFISPTGIFASENATTPKGGEIQRNIIFMTDGDAVAQPCDYTAYGIAWWARRTTNDVGSDSRCNGYGGGYGALNDQVNARLTGLCTAIKNKNIILWVISFGDGSNKATENRLSTCASPNRFFTARDAAALQTTFKSIADQISMLRLTS